ncbi:hypothetical protein, partial [Paenibacillus sp. E194]|uniref:hypothetical protein n=1 Tax=Paenibacillus sp. E194 TaxID=1458845 RepID=UPI0005C7FE38
VAEYEWEDKEKSHDSPTVDEAEEISIPLHEEQAHRERQAESDELKGREQEQVKDNKRPIPAYSTFTWLHANTVKRADGASKQSGSLLSYMNQKSLTSQPRGPKDPAQDLLLMQRERAKREQSSTDKS